MSFGPLQPGNGVVVELLQEQNIGVGLAGEIDQLAACSPAYKEVNCQEPQHRSLRVRLPVADRPRSHGGAHGRCGQPGRCRGPLPAQQRGGKRGSCRGLGSQRHQRHSRVLGQAEAVGGSKPCQCPADGTAGDRPLQAR
jgi:hypothetical protein